MAKEPLKCRRCHGSGLDPMPEPVAVEGYTAEQILAVLAELGRTRAASSPYTSPGRDALDEAYRHIRAQVAEGARLGLSKVRMAEALGVSRPQLYNILNGTPGGKRSTS